MPHPVYETDYSFRLFTLETKHTLEYIFSNSGKHLLIDPLEKSFLQTSIISQNIHNVMIATNSLKKVVYEYKLNKTT